MTEQTVISPCREQTVVPYGKERSSAQPIAWSLAAAASLCLILAPASLLSLSDLVCGPARSVLGVEICLRLLGILLISVLAYLSCEFTRRDYLLLQKNGMVFPAIFAAGLLFRRYRTWDDISNVLIGSMVNRDRHGVYEYELESASDKKRLFIYFKSGGHVSLDLGRMPKSGVDALFLALESWCVTASRVPICMDGQRDGTVRQEGRPNNQHDIAPSTNYTHIWESEMECHFAATNFVTLKKGAVLRHGQYKVLMSIRAGGPSAVYLGENKRGQLVVIKEFYLPAGREESARQKAKELFNREAVILQGLAHPRIARLLDFFVEGGRDYLILEHLAGENIRQLVQKKGLQSERSSLSLARQVCDILDYLHGQSPPVVHRDISPDNLILKEDGRVFLIDFGAANHYVGLATGTLVGKQCYMAPEQFRGKTVPQSDYYSLGATLAFMLTGKDPEALSVSHVSNARDDLDDGVDELVAGLTALTPERRLQTAMEIIERIEKLIPDTLAV